MLQKQLELQFASDLTLVLLKPRFAVNDARFPVILKNSGQKTVHLENISIVHEPSGHSMSVGGLLQRDIAGNDSIETDLFFELNEALKSLGMYDPIERKVLRRDPVKFTVRYEWTIAGLNTNKRAAKELTLVWQGGQYGAGLEWTLA